MSMLGLVGCGAPVEVVPVAAPAAPSVVVAHAEPLAPSEEEAPALVDAEALPSAPATHGRTAIERLGRMNRERQVGAA